MMWFWKGLDHSQEDQKKHQVRFEWDGLTDRDRGWQGGG